MASNFWGLSDGEDALETGGEYEMGGGNFDPIPEKTKVLASVGEVKWDTDRDGNEFLSVQWRIAKPSQYANRQIWQKLWVSDDDPRAKDADKKRDKAKRMLAAIDTNAGGKLSRNAKRPTDEDLAIALQGKSVVIMLGVWEIEGKLGNWVMSVSPKTAEIAAEGAAPARAKPSKAADDDEIPF